MATRRIKMLTNNNYTQPLKLRAGRKLVITPNCSYNSILFTQKHRGFIPSNETVSVWAKFNTNTFDGIQMVAWLEDLDHNLLSSAQCQFKVYYVDVTDNWGQTLIYTTSATLSNGKWVAAPTQANLGAVNCLDGERTLMIEATLSKWGKLYSKKIYVNHLGIYDSIIRLKNEIEFLSITKQDV